MRNKVKYIELLSKSLKLYPETHQNLITTLQGLVEDDYTILDVGCGMKIITRNLMCSKLVGIDICKDYLSNNDIHGDIYNLDKLVKPKSYSVVIAIDVIEHLTKLNGFKLLDDAENIAIKKIIITTPVKWSKNIESVENSNFWSYGNPYNYHKSLWFKEDFILKGYHIVQNGFYNEFILAIKEIG